MVVFLVCLLVVLLVCLQGIDQESRFSRILLLAFHSTWNGTVVSLVRGEYHTPTPVGLLWTLVVTAFWPWIFKGPCLYPSLWYRNVEVGFLNQSSFGYIGDAQARNPLGHRREIWVVCDKDLRPWTPVKIVGVRFTRGFRFYYKVRPL